MERVGAAREQAFGEGDVAAAEGKLEGRLVVLAHRIDRHSGAEEVLDGARGARPGGGEELERGRHRRGRGAAEEPEDRRVRSRFEGEVEGCAHARSGERGATVGEVADDGEASVGGGGLERRPSGRAREVALGLVEW